jgi:hypothetical protein
MKYFRKITLGQPSYVPAAVLGIVSLTAVAFAGSLYRFFNHDEFEAIHAGWKVLSGERIYVDFLQHHHFLLYYVLGGVIAAFGTTVKSVVAARMLMFALAAGIVWLTYGIARTAYGKGVALLGVFFLVTTTMFLQKAVEVRPDVPQVLSGLAAVFFLMEYLASKRTWQLFVSAVLLFVSFLFLQKAVFLAFLIGLLFLYWMRKKQIGYGEFFLYWGTLAVLLGLFFWYVSAAYSLRQYVFLNWIVNTKLLNTFPLYKYLWLSVLRNPLLWALYFAAVGFMFRRRSFDAIAFLSIGLLGFVFVVKSPFQQYYLMALPFVSIVAARFAHGIFEARKSLAPLLLLASTVGSLAAVAYDWKGNGDQLRKVEYVLSVTDANDYVYDGDANFNLFRKDLDYFWFSVKPKTGVLTSYRLMREYDYDVYRLIDELRPKVISDSFVKVKNPVISEHYVRSEAFDGIYIRR